MSSRHLPAAPGRDAARYREQVIFALEVGSNDPAASEETRREAQRCLRNQRLLAGALARSVDAKRNGS